MRLSDLLGCAVHDCDGAYVGKVTDVRLAQTGRVTATMAELVVEALLVSRRDTGSLFGYDRRTEQGPWLVAAVISRIHRRAFQIPWTDTADWDQTQRRITLRAVQHRTSLHSGRPPAQPRPEV